ncbi:hypothetical protein LZ318_34280 [Saccharopolyspora indica]|uniref:hypothetical protein n=1 Tax=Saccharopolyspora indica TaxID=1229659 RepID=UPI0022EA6FFB|nr:hypothetical protein [Saccharopolyspora indica]MDA3647536.1 hypothetical protein [Saccharopolyspora indica]
MAARSQADAVEPSAAEPSLTCAMAATFLDEIYRNLDETYASLGLARWNQPPAEALWQARNLPPAETTAA